VPSAEVELLRASFLELAPEGFEEISLGAHVELAAYEAAAERVAAAFPAARITAVESGWEQRWRAFHRPVRIGELWVGPPWEESPPGSLAVVVDPARAFGTGAHPTTRLCLELLLEQPRGSVVDVGCGSGVLAIAAAKLGHAPAVALDLDRAAVDAARANADANGVSIDIRQADALGDTLPEADLGLANISVDTVVALAPRLHVGRLVTSGYRAGDEPLHRRFRRIERRLLEGWAADLFERR
jgi:ribosomal protein L11 methyltransferase